MGFNLIPMSEANLKKDLGIDLKRWMEVESSGDSDTATATTAVPTDSPTTPKTTTSAKFHTQKVETRPRPLLVRTFRGSVASSMKAAAEAASKRRPANANAHADKVKPRKRLIESAEKDWVSVGPDTVASLRN